MFIAVYLSDLGNAFGMFDTVEGCEDFLVEQYNDFNDAEAKQFSEVTNSALVRDYPDFAVDILHSAPNSQAVSIYG